MTLSERIANERIEKQLGSFKTLRQLAKKPNNLRFDLVIQRNLRWTQEQKSSLVESVLLGYPIPPVYTVKSDDNDLWLLDGKQRLSALISFVNGEWKLTKLGGIYGENVSGLKFTKLPIEFQEIIEEQGIQFYQFDSLSIEQREELFKRLNSGTPLTPIELTRSILGTDLLATIDQLANHKFFKLIHFTKNQREKFIDQELLLQAICLMTGKINLSSKSIRQMAYQLRVKGISKEESENITKVLEFLYLSFSDFDEEIRRKILRKNDIIGIVYAALESDVTPEVFGIVLAEFLLNQSPEYKFTKHSGSAKISMVKKRKEILLEVLRLKLEQDNQAATL